MAIRPISLTEATADQRRDYVRNFLNLEVSGAESDEEISSMIAQAQPGVVNIFVNEPDTPEQVTAGETAGTVPLRQEEAVGRSTGTLGHGDPRAVIFIPVVDSQDDSGARDVLVGVNGRAWQLKRGVELPVPWRVVEALKSAKADIVTHSMEPETLGEVNIRKAQRFGFQVIEGPSQAQIDEWLERTGAEFCA